MGLGGWARCPAGALLCLRGLAEALQCPGAEVAPDFPLGHEGAVAVGAGVGRVVAVAPLVDEEVDLQQKVLSAHQAGVGLVPGGAALEGGCSAFHWLSWAPSAGICLDHCSTNTWHLLACFFRSIYCRGWADIPRIFHVLFLFQSL